MRFRTRGEGSDPGSAERGAKCYLPPNLDLPQCPVDPIVVPFTASRFSTGYVDVVTPDFKKRSAAGEVIISPMWKEYYHMDQSITSCFTSAMNNGVPSHRGGFTTGHTTGNQLLESADDTAVMDSYLASLDVQSERDVAIVKAWSKVDVSEMQALASAGELPETLEFLRDTFVGVIKVLKVFRSKKAKLDLLKKLKRIKPSKYAVGMSDLWMQLRYALRPLVMEAEQCVAVFENGTKPLRSTARGYHSCTVTDISNVVEPVSTSSTATVDVRREVVRSSQYRAGVIYDINAKALGWTELLGLDQPISSMYELVTLSFVLDWVFNLGELISAYEVSSNLTPLGSWVKESHIIVSTETHSNLVIPPIGLFTYSVDSVSYGTLRETRHLERRLPNPELATFPAFRLKLDVLKLVDLAAIARSIYSGIH